MSDLKARIQDKNIPPFERLCLLMEQLRSPDGCAWDREQDHNSLLPYLIEESYELVEAVEEGNDSAIKEELGDLLCQVVFHAQLGRERDAFEIDDSINCIIDKLITRHPHVFDSKRDLDPQQVRDQWEKIKTEKGDKRAVLSGLPRTMPALTMAYRLGEKAGGVGFDWDRAIDVLDKVEEETSELRQELDIESPERKERLTDEIGDLLFAVASFSRKLRIDPETALRTALQKFRNRFKQLENRVRDGKGCFDKYTLDELEDIWQQVKTTQEGD